jgi:hypothetical protein
MPWCLGYISNLLLRRHLLMDRQVVSYLILRVMMQAIRDSVLRCCRGFTLAGLDFPFIVVLARVDIFPTDETQEVVEARGKERSEERSNPVNPVIPGEATVDHIGA